MKTVLILANSSGGLYDFRNELILELLKEYHVAVSLPDTVKTDLLAREGVEVITTPMNRRGVNPSEDLALIKSYRNLLKKVRPDVVLTYTIKPNCYGGYLCGKMGIPYLSTVTGLGSTFQKEGMLRSLVEILYRRGLKKAECVFFQNEENRKIFKDNNLLSGKEIVVSGSGVNLDCWEEQPYPDSSQTNFLFVGRVMKEKGIDEYLEAARVLHSDTVRFSLCGYCDEDYEKKLEEAKKQGDIVLLGFQKDMHPFYRSCSAVVMPTYHEGMSNVLMEASACGRPVIASDIPGCREIMENGVTGFSFAPGSSKELIEALQQFLLLHREEREAMGHRARKKMEKEFDRKNVVKTYLDEIHGILGEK